MILSCERTDSITTWVEEMVRSATGGASRAPVEKLLVGAALQARHPRVHFALSLHTVGDRQQSGDADFQVGLFVYHVAILPSVELIDKCRRNLEKGLQPIILTPGRFLERTKGMAAARGIERRLNVWAIEDFVTQKIVEIVGDSGLCYAEVFGEIVATYNRSVERDGLPPKLAIIAARV